MVGCNFKEFSPYEGDVGEERHVATMLPRIKKLTLQGADNMAHLLKQGSPLHHICANLETLKNCKEMVELITSSKAQCLEQFVRLNVVECEMMREVIASDGDETTYHEIIFRKLKCLALCDLKNLKSFCSGN
ncbi:hypothetical protein Gotur_026229, partial [Gossypium turneri]